MGNGFSIERAASDTAISSKSGLLTRIFKQLLHSQFSNIISDLERLKKSLRILELTHKISHSSQFLVYTRFGMSYHDEFLRTKKFFHQKV